MKEFLIAFGATIFSAAILTSLSSTEDQLLFAYASSVAFGGFMGSLYAEIRNLERVAKYEPQEVPQLSL